MTTKSIGAWHNAGTTFCAIVVLGAYAHDAKLHMHRKRNCMCTAKMRALCTAKKKLNKITFFTFIGRRSGTYGALWRSCKLQVVLFAQPKKVPAQRALGVCACA